MAMRSLAAKTAVGRAAGEHDPERPMAGLLGECIGLDHEFRLVGQGVREDAGSVPIAPVGASRRVLRSGDVADPAVAKRREMGDHPDGRGMVVDDDREVLGAAGRPVEEDERKGLLAQLGDRVVGHLRGRDEETVDLALPKHAQVGRLTFRLVLRVAQDEVVAPQASRVLGALDDRREERVGDVRDKHPERQRPLQAKAAGEGRGPVAEAVGGRQDAQARLRPHR